MQNDPVYGIRERSIPLSIVLTVITCGIYGLYWIYKLHEEANFLCGRREEMSPALVVLLCIVTCGIYQVYWAYTQGEKFRDEANMRGSREADDSPVLFLVLEVANYFVGVTSIIDKALMQDRINQILRRRGMGDRPYEENRYYYGAEQDIAREYEQAERDYNAQAQPEARTDQFEAAAAEAQDFETAQATMEAASAGDLTGFYPLVSDAPGGSGVSDTPDASGGDKGNGTGANI